MYVISYKIFNLSPNPTLEVLLFEPPHTFTIPNFRIVDIEINLFIFLKTSLFFHQSPVKCVNSTNRVAYPKSGTANYQSQSGKFEILRANN